MAKLLVSFYDWLTANPAAFSPGPGLFSTLHICLMVFLAVWLVGTFFIFRRFPKFTKYAILGMCIYILVARVFRMVLCVATGINTWFEVMPFHLCHIMSFLLPICVFFNWKKPLPAFLLYSFFGGVLTFIFGDYYKYSMLTFLDIESIILHTILPTIVIAFIAIKQIKMTIKDMIIVPVMLACLAGWAWVGNTVIPGANYMYIKANGLPFNLFPNHHFLWTYLVMMIASLTPIYTAVLVINHKNKIKMGITVGGAETNTKPSKKEKEELQSTGKSGAKNRNKEKVAEIPASKKNSVRTNNKTNAGRGKKGGITRKKDIEKTKQDEKILDLNTAEDTVEYSEPENQQGKEIKHMQEEKKEIKERKPVTRTNSKNKPIRKTTENSINEKTKKRVVNKSKTSKEKKGGKAK